MLSGTIGFGVISSAATVKQADDNWGSIHPHPHPPTHPVEFCASLPCVVGYIPAQILGVLFGRNGILSSISSDPVMQFVGLSGCVTRFFVLFLVGCLVGCSLGCLLGVFGVCVRECRNTHPVYRCCEGTHRSVTRDGTSDWTNDGTSDGTRDWTSDGTRDGISDGTRDWTSDGTRDWTNDGTRDATVNGETRMIKVWCLLTCLSVCLFVCPSVCLSI